MITGLRPDGLSEAGRAYKQRRHESDALGPSLSSEPPGVTSAMAPGLQAGWRSPGPRLPSGCRQGSWTW